MSVFKYHAFISFMRPPRWRYGTESLTPCCIMQREDFCNNHWLYSPLHHTAERFGSPLQNATARFDSPLHTAAERFDSPLHYAARSQTLILITPRIWKKIRKNLGYESGSKVCSFDEKKGGKYHATVPLRVETGARVGNKIFLEPGIGT
jgi:hypothetical protein